MLRKKTLVNFLILKLVKFHCNFIVSLSTTAINDRHASQRNGFSSTAGIHQKRSVPSRFAWTMDFHVGGLLQAPSETQVNHRTQKKRVNYTTACHRNRSTRLLKASHYDWRDAQKLTVNNPSTQSDCQASDIIVKYRHLKRKHCVVSVTVLRCFGANVSSARKSLIIGHAKIAIIGSYLKITNSHLALTVTVSVDRVVM